MYFRIKISGRNNDLDYYRIIITILEPPFSKIQNKYKKVKKKIPKRIMNVWNSFFKVNIISIRLNKIL